jgi:D-xylose transport system substrate-binding protein
VSRRADGPLGGRSRWLLLALAVLVAAFSVAAAGCGDDDDDEAGATGADTTATTDEGDGGGEADGSIWVLLPDSASSDRWEKDDRRFFEAAFDEAGVEYNIVNAEGDASTQLQQAEQAINAGAKVILLVNLSSESGATIIETAREADVQVVDYDRLTAAGAGADVYVSFDNVRVGQTMADTVGPVIDDLDAETPKVVMMNGGPTDNNSKLFKEGYNETGDYAVSKKVDAGEWELVADQDVPDWDNQQALTLFEQILVANDNAVDAVFAANDGIAGAVISALQSANAGPIPVSGQDATAGRGRGRGGDRDRAPERRGRRVGRGRLGGPVDQQRRGRPAVHRPGADRRHEGQHRRDGDRGRVPHVGRDLHGRVRGVLPRGPLSDGAGVSADTPARPR